MTDPADPVLLFDEDGRMFVLHDPALASDLIESEEEFLEGYDGRGRPVRARGEPGHVGLTLVSTEPRPDKLRARVERYYSVFAARHPTRTPPPEADLVAFVRAVAEDWIEE
ncbi:hypothetical protein AB0937_01530 [Streptomyces sp. NPDC047880]|uniref:hypothetical protein n=1 Tax=Streptomyces sp. NPDC047880 TaxID=3155626 RepID=UPI0034556C63